jgi:hypothetical protein
LGTKGVVSSQEFRPSNELWPGGRTCVTMQLAPLRSRCRVGSNSCVHCTRLAPSVCRRTVGAVVIT